MEEMLSFLHQLPLLLKCKH